jgi:PilZ domain
VSTPERRTEERIACNVKGYLQAAGDSPLDCFWWWCMLQDISLQGCQFVTQRPLAAGTALALDLSVPGSPTSCTLHAQVVHSAAEAEKSHRVGCRFLRALQPHELEALQAVSAQRKGVWVQPGAPAPPD